jgi:hypothetical protein
MTDGWTVEVEHLKNRPVAERALPKRWAADTGDLQAPHPELSKQKPLIFVVPEGKFLYRHHQKALEPVYCGKNGDYRFDDPGCPAPGSFGPLYAGEDPECCLMESIPPHQGVPAVKDSATLLYVASFHGTWLAEAGKIEDVLLALGVLKLLGA